MNPTPSPFPTLRRGTGERQEEMKRKSGSRKRSLIKTTKREPRWKRELRALWKEFKREAWNALAGVGIFVVILLILRIL